MESLVNAKIINCIIDNYTDTYGKTVDYYVNFLKKRINF